MRICSSSVGRGALIGGIAALAVASGASAATTIAGPAGGTASGAAVPATISVANRCYVNRSPRDRAPMTITGSGFAAGGEVQISSSDGSVKGDTTASATGTIAFTTSAPDPSFTLPGQQTVTLTATQTTAAITATAPVTVAPLAVGIRPSEAVPSQKVTWYFSGFDPSKLIFGHYLRKQQVALARFGRAGGACGVLQARAPLYPGGHPQYHLYGLQLDDSQRYSKNSSPRLDKQVQFLLVSRPPSHATSQRLLARRTPKSSR
jgi:hypothetical protein